MAAAVERPLKELADAFHNLSLTVATPNSPPMTVEAFLGACSKMPAIITAAFDASDYLVDEFVQKRELIQSEELRSKVSNQATTLAELIDQDMANNSVRIDGSSCRLILRLWRAIDFVKVMFQELLNGRDVSLQTAALNAYKSVFGRYEDMNVMEEALFSIMELPTRAEIQDKINETEDDEIIQMKRYVDGSTVVIEDVGKLFETRKVSTDW